MSDDSGRPGLKQLSWIAAGVAALTLLVVAASWLFSPRPSAGDGAALRGPAVLKEEQVQKDTFSPEAPGGRPAPPVPQATLPETQAQRPVAPAAEVQAPPATPGPQAETATPHSEKPAPKEPLPAPKSEPEPKSPSPQARTGYGVQVGAFTEQSKAREVAGRLESLRYKALILNRDGKFKVIATGFPDRAAAGKAQEALAKAGIKDPFIVSLE